MNRNFIKAKELLSKANEIKPNNLSVLNNLGTAYKELGDSKKARKKLKWKPKASIKYLVKEMIDFEMKNLS